MHEEKKKETERHICYVAADQVHLCACLCVQL